MTETGLVALVGVLGTLVGTIGGAWIARRAALEQLRSQRYGEATDAARAVIVRLIIAGRQWRDSLIGITFELAQAESLADSEALRLASIGTDPHSGDAVTRGRIALGDALAGAQILAWSDELDAAIERVAELPPRWWNEVIMVNEASIGSDETVADREDRADRFDDEIIARLHDVVQLARVSFSPRAGL